MRKKIQIGEIVERSKKLEAKLKALKAEGRGMHELLTSVEDKLEPELVKKLRQIATIRNKAIHEPEFDVDGNIEVFHNTCDEAEKLFPKSETKKRVRKSAPAKNRKAKSRKNTPESKFNILFLLPFIPGLNLFYFIFLLILSLLPGLKYIIVIAAYALAFTGLIYGVNKDDNPYIISSLCFMAMLYIYNIFIASNRYPKLRYIPLLNTISGLGKIKNKIHWSLFFISLASIALVVVSGYLIFTTKKLLLGITLFTLTYLSGILHFIYSGRSKHKK
jgi:hypothetical protein